MNKREKREENEPYMPLKHDILGPKPRDLNYRLGHVTELSPGREKIKNQALSLLALKLVPHPTHREDVPRMLNVVLDFLAETVDEVVYGARGAVVIEAPHLVEDGVTGQYFALGVDEEAQKLKLLGGQKNIGSPQLHRLRV